jgi:hypothetical protein
MAVFVLTRRVYARRAYVRTGGLVVGSARGRHEAMGRHTSGPSVDARGQSLLIAMGGSCRALHSRTIHHWFCHRQSLWLILEFAFLLMEPPTGLTCALSPCRLFLYALALHLSALSAVCRHPSSDLFAKRLGSALAVPTKSMHTSSPDRDTLRMDYNTIVSAPRRRIAACGAPDPGSASAPSRPSRDTSNAARSYTNYTHSYGTARADRFALIWGALVGWTGMCTSSCPATLPFWPASAPAWTACVSHCFAAVELSF